MKLPRFAADIVRRGEAPELISKRNFDRLDSILSDAFKIVEAEFGLVDKTIFKAIANYLAGGKSITVAGLTVSGTSSFGGSVSNSITVLTGNTTLTAVHNVLEADATSGSFTITLPAASGCTGRRYIFHKNDTSTNTVTIDGNGSETIDGSTTIVLGGNLGRSHLTIRSNGTTWRIEWLYEEGTFPWTLVGCTTSPSSTVNYTRSGKMVNLSVPAVTGTSNTTAMSLTGMPSHIYPLINIEFSPPSVLDNGLDRIGYTKITTAGVCTFGFYSTISTLTTTFTNSGTKGLGATFSATYRSA